MQDKALIRGDRDQQREEFGNAVIDTLTEFTPNIKELILHKQVIMPWDIEQDEVFF